MAERKPEITGPCPELAKLVLAITGDVARMTAAVRSGVSHDTIARMWRGERVSEAMILRFSMGYGTDPNPLLKAAGYQPLPNYHYSAPPKDRFSQVRESTSDTGTSETKPRRYITDPDYASMMDAYEGLPPGMQQSIANLIHKAAEDFDREHPDKARPGRRSDEDDNPTELAPGEWDEEFPGV